MSDRYKDLAKEELDYIAKYGYIEALSTDTIGELSVLCESVGLQPKGKKQNYLSAIENYRNSTVERGCIDGFTGDFITKPYK